MKMENVQNKNGWGLLMIGVATFSAEPTRWKEALAYTVLGVVLMVIEQVFKPVQIPHIDPVIKTTETN